MSVLTNKFLVIIIVSCLLGKSCSHILKPPTRIGIKGTVKDNFTQTCILPDPLCGMGIETTLKSILDAGPNLREAILQLEGTDFLEKYKKGEKSEDKDLNITQLVAKYGFKLQSYPIVTEDGYKIVAYRIPGDGDPVLLVHGILNSAIDWFTIGRESALPCFLADQGYDVWLFNARGTTEESRGHVRLDVVKDDKEYWDFSWEELGLIDLPTTIDFVLKESRRPTLKYVGHSQGTTSFFVMASMRPEYDSKISLAVMLSPVAWMSKLFSPLIRIIAPPGEKLAGVLRNIVGFTHINAENPLIQFVTDYVCGNSELAKIVCSNLLFSFSGFDYDQMNATQLPVIFGHTPSSVSSKQLAHYGQEIDSGKFRRYDFGNIKNMAVYGTVQPPDYPVERITAPVALFYRSSGDWFSAYEDVLTLRSKLRHVMDFYEVPHDSFCHTDYLWAKDVKKLVYDRILELFKKY